MSFPPTQGKFEYTPKRLKITSATFSHKVDRVSKAGRPYTMGYYNLTAENEQGSAVADTLIGISFGDGAELQPTSTVQEYQVRHVAGAQPYYEVKAGPKKPAYFLELEQRVARLEAALQSATPNPTAVSSNGAPVPTQTPSTDDEIPF